MLGWFRRHAKILMVVLGSAAMAIFGLGPVFDELARGGGRNATGENRVVATWDGGQIKRSDLDLWQRGHYQAQRFLQGVRDAAEQKKGDRVISLALPLSRLQEESGQKAVDEQLVSKFLLSERAKTEGVIVSDGMVEDYIALTSGDAGFSNRDLEAINKEVNTYCSLQSVKEHLKFELLANQMQIFASAAIPTIPNPNEAMELYSRTAEQVECEVLAINVEKYFDQIKDEFSAAELKAVYEEGKYDFPDPLAENPGFKIGPKVKVQYFKADFETALTNEMNKLTDEEIQKEYERLVEEKNPIVMEPIKMGDDSITIPGAPPSTGGETPTTDGGESTDTPGAPPADGGDSPLPPPTGEASGAVPAGVTPPPSGSGTTPTTPMLETPKAGTTTPVTPMLETPKSGTTPATPMLETPKSGTTTPVVEPGKTLELPTGEIKLPEVVPGTPATLDIPPTKGGTTIPPALTDPVKGGQSLTVTKRKFQFVSTGPQEPETESTEPIQLTQKELQVEPSTETPAVQTPETSTPVVEPGTTQTPATGTQTPVTGTPATETPAASTPDSTQDPGGIGEIMEGLANTEDDADDNRKAKPLKDVVDDVKRSMCREKAKSAMKEALARATNPVEVYYQSIVRWESQGKKGDPPAPMDAEEIAKEYGLTTVETELLDDVELMSDPLGALGIPARVRANGRIQNTIIPVGQMIFDQFDEINPYETQEVDDIWGSQSGYVFWITEKTETYVPTFKECQPEVEKFMRQNKALEMAMAEATAKCKEVNDKRTETMGNLFGEKAVPTGSFSWFTSFGEARYSMPNGVTAPGEEFMTTAFGLAKLEAGVAPNALKDTVYVIQAIEPSRTMSEAGYDFLANQYFKYKRIPNESFMVNQRYIRNLSITWNQELQDQMNFKFVDR